MAGATYWIGQDGNLYFGSGVAGAGVQNMGSAKDYTYNNGSIQAYSDLGVNNKAAQALASGAGAITGVTQIKDPALANTAPANPTGASHPVLNQAAVNNTQGTIDQIAPLLSAALGSEDQTYQNTNGLFDQQQTTAQQTHDASTDQNQNNYDSNFMASIRAGVKGLGSLVSLLRGTGAAGGTAEDQVRDVVGGTTADDIRGGADTLKNNQNQVDSSLSQVLTDLKGKRQANDDTHTNNRSAIQRDSNTQLQDLYSKMAGFYGDAGDTANANAFMAKAGSLTPAIAANSRTAVSKYDTTPVVIHAPNLTAFSAPSQPQVATAPADGQVGSGIFAIDNRRKDTAAPNPSAVPAASSVPLVPQGA